VRRAYGPFDSVKLSSNSGCCVSTTSWVIRCLDSLALSRIYLRTLLHRGQLLSVSGIAPWWSTRTGTLKASITTMEDGISAISQRRGGSQSEMASRRWVVWTYSWCNCVYVHLLDRYDWQLIHVQSFCVLFSYCVLADDTVRVE
jgi:hypothetical protein